MYGASVTPTNSGQYATQSAPRIAPLVSPPVANRTTKKHKKKKAGGVPNINKYLAGDTTYQDQASQLMKQLEQFRTSNTSQRGMVNQDFNTALGKMKLQKTQDQSNMAGDYAARGLLNSGLFVKAGSDYDTNYQNQYNDLTTGQSRSLSDLLESLQNYQTENRSSLLSARQDAIRRRAQRYGITT